MCVSDLTIMKQFVCKTFFNYFMNGSLPLEINLSFIAVKSTIKTKYCFRMENWLYLMNFI